MGGPSELVFAFQDLHGHITGLGIWVSGLGFSVSRNKWTLDPKYVGTTSG